MKTLKQVNKAPKLAIIDEAIRLIATGEEFYMCVAFSHIVQDIIGRYHTDDLEYRLQLEMFVMRKYRKLPRWWSRCEYNFTDKQNKKHKKERLKILQEFRNACIEAGRRK